MAFLAVREDAGVLGESAELVRFELVLLDVGVVAGTLAAREAPGAFDDFSFTKKVGGVEGTFLIGSFEDHAISKVESEDPGFLFSEWWHE